MGQILSQPVVSKESSQGENDKLYYGISAMQGWRVSMEDAHATILDLESSTKTDDQHDGSIDGKSHSKVAFFGVYDGHGGQNAALYTGNYLHEIIAQEPAFKNGDYAEALRRGFLKIDQVMHNDKSFEQDPSGCTATTAIITDEKILVANAGDSRTVLGVKGTAKAMSYDHKPQNEGERARIRAAGGFVDQNRVNGNLALSRAIGDFDFKKSGHLPPEEQIVTSNPDILERIIAPEDEFLILACDGIWDCMYSQTAVEFVRRGIAAKQELDKICENLLDNCLAPESDIAGLGCDNMTVVIVALLNGKTKEEWYDMIAKRVQAGDGPVAPESAAELIGNPFADGSAENNQMNNARHADGPASFGSGAQVLQQLLSGVALTGPDLENLLIGSSSNGKTTIGLKPAHQVNDTEYLEEHDDNGEFHLHDDGEEEMKGVEVDEMSISGTESQESGQTSNQDDEQHGVIEHEGSTIKQ